MRVADLWSALMTDVLGFDRFAAAGGDIGSAVTRFLGLNHADHVVAIHRTDAGVPVFGGDAAELGDEERRYLDEVARWAASEGAYAALHRTKPQTLAYALNDSPIGLAAWIVEKLRAWSDCGGDVERSFTRDEICALLTRYWLTGTNGSSMRMYAANAAIVGAGTAGSIDVFVTNSTDLVIDINGYFAPMTTGGLSLYNVSPCRILDTRLPTGTAHFAGSRDAQIADTYCGVPAAARAEVLAVAVVPAGPPGLGYLTLWPQGQTQPTAATLNAIDAAITSNLAIVPTTNGIISAFASNPTHLVLDAFGYFAP